MTTLNSNFFFYFLSAFLITYLAIPKLIHFAKKLNLLDTSGDRSSHKVSTPFFGGIAIFTGVIFSLLFWSDIESIQFILVSILTVFIVGLIDDLRKITAFKKLIGQIIATFVLIFLGDLQIDSMHGVLGVYDLPIWASLSFTIFVVIVITNAFNLIDGIDGLAGGIGLISSLSFGGIALIMDQSDMALIAFTLSGALVGFLKFNTFPARIFMGDTGSLVVGMILAVLAINCIKFGLVTETHSLPHIGPLLAISLLAIPLFDSLRVFVVRAINRKGTLTAARDHVHHALIDLGAGHKYTSLILYIVAVIIILFTYALLIFNLNVNVSITILAVFSFLLWLIPVYMSKSNYKIKYNPFK
ncbi:undecaprenyl/decaprenyl-phosphate alpha-N-acetylglucosaminyl 1-phosphate transferase [Flavobacteriales bacterium]|nr:undecaprenyl/decaprenyl-phosphate alpha-N-acetylglucosaminyl 1-phosphate transferase [Flavobacteriales bacterium]